MDFVAYIQCEWYSMQGGRHFGKRYSKDLGHKVGVLRKNMIMLTPMNHMN